MTLTALRPGELWIALILLWAAADLAQAATWHPTPADNGPLLLGLSAEVLEDPDGAFTILQLMQGKQTGFTPLPAAETANLGYSESAFWIRVFIGNKTDQALLRLLEIPFPTLDQVSVYLVEQSRGRLVQRMRGGDRLPFDARPMDHRHFVFPLKLAAHSDYTLYLRIRSEGSLTVPLKLWAADPFHSHSARGYSALSFYFGVLIALLAYNLLLYLSLRDRAYLYYVLFVASMAVGQGAWSGLFFQYLWPGWPQWANIAALVGFNAAGMFGAVFSRTFLDTRRVAPYLDRLIGAFTVLFGLLLTATPTLPYLTTAMLTSLIGIGFSIVAVAAGVMLMLRRYSPARYFLLAWSILLLGTATLGARNLGWLPTNFFTNNAMMIGNALEMLLLSFALAVRIAELQKKNTVLQRQEVHLKSLAHRDTLTGLGNRLALNERLKGLRQKGQTETDFGLLMIDLDHFKPVNDTYGHAVGDELLCAVAGRIRHSIRPDDGAYRLGGDEFVVILNKLGSETPLHEIGDKIQKLLAQPFTIGQHQIQVSASVGAVHKRPWMLDPYDLLRDADQAMYKAKISGRNRVVSAPTDAPHSAD